MNEVTIIGGGLAGTEAAWQAARLGVKVSLFEMKPVRFSPAHHNAGLAELVCSNSFKAMSLENAGGLLKEELRLLGSLVMEAAVNSRVPAGSALAVDREAFSKLVTSRLVDAGVRIIRGEVVEMPAGRPLVIATGPLTSDAFALAIGKLVGKEYLHFYDAVAPIVHADSVDMSVAFFASRYDKGGADYINCPMDERAYNEFVTALLNADHVEARSFEEIKYFEGCLPMEVMAGRGLMTLAYGPMKPVGITDPRTGKRPFAIVQLRKENAAGTLYNLVGFQTRLTFEAQKKVFCVIPGLADAKFARFGKMHRNSYIDSPRLLDAACALRSDPSVFFAGQMTGVEGYSESTASGLIAGINAARSAKGLSAVTPPDTTMLGALQRHISDAGITDFQPMNSSFGLLPPIDCKKKERKSLLAWRALKDMAEWAGKIA
jgi:methylenetetrahydrofolate--tRNA-(uracil-5-)-methyltransferase